MNRRLTALIVLFVAFMPTAFALQKPCSAAEHKQVEIEAESLRTWDALYNSYREYKHCNDVDAAEGYSESKARILADHWETLPRLAQLIEKDNSFETFVGLDSTMGMGDVAKIRRNALKRCPVGLRKLCAKLKKNADEAIAEDASSRKQNK